MMKKLLILKISYENMGGIDRQILRHAREHYRSNFFEPILGTSDISSPLAMAFSELGLSVYQVALGKGFSLADGLRDVIKLMETEHIVAIQTHLFRESLVGRLVKRKNKKIIHIFRAQTYIDCAWIPEWKKQLYHLLDKVSSNYVDLYVANGPVVEKEIANRSHVNPNKIKVVNNGCDPLAPAPELYQNKENSFLTPRIAMVANLIAKKGHDVLIQALAICQERGLFIEAVLIGDEISGGVYTGFDSFKDYLMDIAIKYKVQNQITFYGYSKNIFLAIKDIDVIVLPSDSEGMPNAIIEAMSIKKVVISSEVGAVSTIIDHGINGYLHPPRDPESFAEILLDVFRTPQQDLVDIRENAFVKWKNNFSTSQMMGQMQECYERFINK